MNPDSITITFPPAVVAWADENGIDLEAYIEAVIGPHIESVVFARPPAVIADQLAAIRAESKPRVSRRAEREARL